MKRPLKYIPAALTVLFGLALLTASVYAQEGKTFVYTDNNPADPNSVSAFRVGRDGTLVMVAGSPFSTGGMGSGGGFFSSHRITATVVRRNFLYVANDGSDDISAFKIDTDRGGLTPVPDSPFGSGGTAGFGISLAATPNGRFLYAGNGGSGNISAFRIASKGALVPIGSVPAGGTPDGMKVSPSGKVLGVALANSDSVAMFRIGSDGRLTAVSNSPFAAGDFGIANDVDINCKSNRLFDPKATAVGTTVAVFTIAPDGALSPIAGSPFTFARGTDSSVGVLSPDNQHLFVSNQGSDEITVLDVASGGSLTQESGSPFAIPLGFFPAGMGTNREGDLLYVTNADQTVSGFHIDSDGGLTPVTGSPFSTGIPPDGFLESLTVFPAHADEGEGDEVDASGHKGHFDFEADRRCPESGEMHFADDSGRGMDGSVDAVSVQGNTAIISGPGTLLDGTPVQYTAVVTGNLPVVGSNLFSISWITATGSIFQTTGSIFQTSGALIDGYIAVHP